MFCSLRPSPETQRKFTLTQLPKQNESSRHVRLGFVSVYLKRQWLHLWACFDPLLSRCRQRIRTASCRSSWSWWRSCSRRCRGRRRCPRWRQSRRPGRPRSPWCRSGSPVGGWGWGAARARGEPVPVLSHRDPARAAVHTGARTRGSCCPFEMGALPECQAAPASVSSLR